MDLGLYDKTFKRFPKPVLIGLVALSGVLCLLELVLIGTVLPDASDATDWCDKQQFCDDHCDCDGVCNKTFPACECAEFNYEASELVEDLGTAGVSMGYLMFILLSIYKVYLLIKKLKEEHTWKKFEKKMAAVLTPIAAGGVLYEIAIEYKGGCAEYTPMKMPTLFFAILPTLLMIGSIMYFLLLVWWNHKGALRRDDMTLREPAIALLGLSITPLTTSGVFGVWAIFVGFQMSGPGLGAVVCLFLDCLVCLAVVTSTVDFEKFFASKEALKKKRKDKMLEMQMMHNMTYDQSDGKRSLAMSGGFDGAIIDQNTESPGSLRSNHTDSLCVPRHPGIVRFCSHTRTLDLHQPNAVWLLE
ncbi:hypothetical protein CYMTET_46130 [Cymbomonas tetramitiformis]|uniref:Uncharacterized protein n=1 Tax=Cymbomonas tetramitiformis TaxID=36881 RepID=A0AAE0BYM4_9CHLO|nr:hypothetical protein CYMTET_46130 [Cymbomonas tetramitiformis]